MLVDNTIWHLNLENNRYLPSPSIIFKTATPLEFRELGHRPSSNITDLSIFITKTGVQPGFNFEIV